MCPLRIILIFLSATLAGFFVLRNLNNSQTTALSVAPAEDNNPSSSPPPLSSKVCGAIGKGFSTFVDMASGRYLWKNLIAVSSSSSSLSDSYSNKLSD